MAKISFFSKEVEGINWRLISILVSVFSVILLLVWGTQALEKPSVFPIQSVSVKAQLQYVTPQQIQAIIKPFLNKGMLGVQTEKIQKALLTLPWVETASISREWPHKLLVQLTEKKPVAIWQGQWVTTDGSFILPPKNASSAGLVSFQGPGDKEPEIMQQYQQFAQMLEPLGLVISSVALMGPEGSWRVGLVGGPMLQLGHEQVSSRLALFVKMYSKVFTSSDQQAELVDLRYPNGFAVKWVKQKVGVNKV